MWAVIGVWTIDDGLRDAVNAQVPAMAQGKIGMPGFVHGTWTNDGHAILVFDDETTARKYHDDMRSQGLGERPGLRCVLFDIAEVGAESRT
jgi:hypothetical protein